MNLSIFLRRTRATVASLCRVFSAATAETTESGALVGGGRDTLGGRLLRLTYTKRSAVVSIRKWKEEGHTVGKYELNRIVRELRKIKRYKHALEVEFRLLRLLSGLMIKVFFFFFCRYVSGWLCRKI